MLCSLLVCLSADRLARGVTSLPLPHASDAAHSNGGGAGTQIWHRLFLCAGAATNTQNGWICAFLLRPKVAFARERLVGASDGGIS